MTVKIEVFVPQVATILKPVKWETIRSRVLPILCLTMEDARAVIWEYKDSLAMDPLIAFSKEDEARIHYRILTIELPATVEKSFVFSGKGQLVEEK